MLELSELRFFRIQILLSDNVDSLDEILSRGGVNRNSRDRGGPVNVGVVDES